VTESNPRAPQTYEEWLAEAAKKAEATARASRLFNPTAVDRILDAVGKRYWPPTLNRENLTEDLERSARIHSIWDLLGHQPSDRVMLKRVERLNSSAKRFGRTLPSIDNPAGENSDPLMRLLLRAADDGSGIPKIQGAVDGARFIAAISDEILNDFPNLGWDGQQSAESWLISQALPKIYAQHFARPFRMSRQRTKPRHPSGPGIRFVVSVLSVMGVVTRDRKPYGPEAIEHYLR